MGSQTLLDCPAGGTCILSVLTSSHTACYSSVCCWSACWWSGSFPRASSRYWPPTRAGKLVWEVEGVGEAEWGQGGKRNGGREAAWGADLMLLVCAGSFPLQQQLPHPVSQLGFVPMKSPVGTKIALLWQTVAACPHLKVLLCQPVFPWMMIIEKVPFFQMAVNGWIPFSWCLLRIYGFGNLTFDTLFWQQFESVPVNVRSGVAMNENVRTPVLNSVTLILIPRIH